MGFLRWRSSVLDDKSFRATTMPSEEAILARWAGLAEPIVSVICTTFNQVEYIEDALRGILIQETEFPFEVIIQDDVSTDGTREFVLEFAQRYPKLVRLILPERNLFQQGVRPLIHASQFARSDLIAICEGDDYWIDQAKLQTQVDLMLERSDVMLVHSSGFRQCQDLGLYPAKKWVKSSFSGRSNSARTLLRGNAVLTSTAVYRSIVFNELIASKVHLKRWPFMDYALALQAVQLGEVVERSERFSVYRKVEGSLTNSGAKAMLKMHIAAHDCRMLFARNLPIDESERNVALHDASVRLLSLCARYGDSVSFKLALDKSEVDLQDLGFLRRCHIRAMLEIEAYRTLVQFLHKCFQRIKVFRRVI